MTADAAMRSPLDARLADLKAIAERTEGRVIVEHVAFLAQVDVRLGSQDVARAPFPLPTAPNTVWERGSRAALWLGPDEWLVLGPPATEGTIVAELEAALAGLARSVVDVCANRVALELSGPDAKALLATGCALDLDPRSWRPGMCAQTLFARTPVILHERADATRILVRPSYADDLLDRLLDASAP